MSKSWRKSAAAEIITVFFLAFLPGCSGGVSSTNANGNSSSSGASVSVSPASANVRAGDSYTFTATVSGAQNTSVTWSVNGTTGGSPTVGTIDTSGKYTAPISLPSPNTMTIRATSVADASVSGSATVTLLNPTPTLTGISPASTNLGSFALTVTGTKFVSGAQVLFGGTPLSTTFVSATQLNAQGNATSSGTFTIAVQNPDPGSSSSTSVNFQVNGSPQAASCSGMSLGAGASLNGYRPFPSDNAWNTDISNAPVDLNSNAIINFIGGNVGLHADFGSGQYQGSYIGIPYLIVGPQQPQLDINYMAYGDESDPGPMPIPVTTNIEGYPNPGSGDRHVLVLDTTNCFLYELYSSYPQSNSWSADSGAVWDLQANEQRPFSWTSADAAGLPLFPGLARFDEVAAGAINHALRFTLALTRAALTPPATHWAGNSTNPNAPPMGMRLRLKASFDISGYSAANQVILKAMKKYGLILADNGSSMYISGAPDDRWNNDDLHLLGNVTASDFEVVQMNPIYTSSNLPAGVAPQITSFSASSANVAAGTQVTLSWQATGASYVIVSPGIGAVRGTTATVTPSATTTYTLYATNAYGRTTSALTIMVH
ncbi:MAG TPA: IPT/TIG domain-containing protein [Candidatus Acidoferrum sp.]|nr:IPT/TIG domain-containing protein [Candidatus Acidoferrum sp.]